MIIIFVCITLTGSSSQPPAYFPGFVIWQLLWTGAVQFGGLQPDNCGSCLVLVNALKCHPPTPSTPPPDPVCWLSSPVQPVLQHQCLSCYFPLPIFFLTHTHLVNLGHATAVGHLGRRVKEHKIRILHVVTCVFVQHRAHSITPHSAH